MNVNKRCYHKTGNKVNQGKIKIHKTVVIKVVDKNNPDAIQQAKGELEGAGFTIQYEQAADQLGIDPTQLGEEYTDIASMNAYVLVGEK